MPKFFKSPPSGGWCGGLGGHEDGAGAAAGGDGGHRDPGGRGHQPGPGQHHGGREVVHCRHID